MNAVAGDWVIGGRFRLVQLLGEGGMGVVWEAEELATGRRRAIKFMKQEARSVEAEKRFLREAETANAVRHPSILHVDEVTINDDGTPAFVTDLLDGESLQTRLEREQRLPLGQAAAILRPVVAALRAAHAAGVVHRDLKPDNIFLTLEPNGGVGVRVLDFGIARMLDRTAEKLTVTGTIMGTPLYMSPEQAAGESEIDPRTDVWSMAVIVFECLTGTTPVTGDNYGQLLSRLIKREIRRLRDMPIDLPADVRDVVDSALVDRALRSPDLGQLEMTLARHADHEVMRPSARIPVASDSRLSAPRVRPPQAQIETQSATVFATTRPPDGSRAIPIVLGVLAMLAVVGVLLTWVALSKKRTAIATTVPTSETVPAAATSTALPTAPSATPSAAPSIAPSAAPSIAPSVPTIPTVTPVPSATTKPSGGVVVKPRPPVVAKPATPKPLPGGVAGDAPF